MRVLVAAPSLAAVGGVAVYTSALVDTMDEVTHFDQWWPLTSRSDSVVVRSGVHGLGLGRWVAALRAARPDLVHLQVTSPGIPRDIVYLRLARQAGIPAIAHLHTSGFVGEGASATAAQGIGQVVELASGVIVMSQAVADELAALFPAQAHKVHVVPNPAPVLPEPASPTQKANDGTYRLVCVGEVCDRKGQGPLVRTVDALVNEGLDLHLELVGPPGEMVAEDRAVLESSTAVTVSGVRRGAELTAAYDRADAFVLFARSEAEPLAILEAMTRGLPVVATAVGSIPATLGQAGDGNAVVAVDDVTALADALRRLTGDPAAARAIGESNRRWVSQERSLTTHVARLREVYAAVLGR